MTNILENSAQQFIELIFPRSCVVCQCKLIQSEQYLCLRCLLQMPRTNHHKQRENVMEQLFYGRVPIERGCSFFEFKKGSQYQQILHELKYRGQKQLGEYIGVLFGTSLKEDASISSADLICPVPLHPRKEKKRGYNQSYHIAVGLSQSLGIPINNSNLRRCTHSSTQTRKSRWERWQNVESIFELQKPEQFEGKHLILIDDVVTTGATLEACATAILSRCNARVSVLTLAIA
ncbi:ComF family protein [Mangrovibacterium marinum]|uniref:ComF family protein n=1 Tax=Mangrovibacterium marinum TaxID=1639118 RepID=A0A2T5C6S5_9BACT|nr:phosphoribosyltransferase family protein [Mangrovibacterium marinum]PTN10644.1 ComF family protein [Mangrovibacterium marinum]